MLTFEEKLLNIVKKDDIKSFNAMMRDVNLGNLRMGRFPVLSLLYLYGARKLLSAYETGFLKVSTWESVGEPIEVSQFFAKKAGKCLRLYFDEVVSPIEMLLILDRTRRVKKAYPVAKPSEAVRKRLKAIYSIKYALNVSYRGNDIVLDRRPLTRREKRRLALACIGCVLILAVLIGAPVTAASLLPDLDAGEVTQLKHIDFASRETYTLLKDIYIPDGYTVDAVTCGFKGGGGRLIFGKGATLGRFNGKIENLEICTAGSPIFEICTNLAELENVTVNVDADVSISSDSAFVATVNYGVFKNVKVNASGVVHALAGETSDESATGMSLGGIVAQNVYAGNGVQRVYGSLENCSINFDDLRLEGELEANASFGGLVGENRAYVTGGAVTGSVSAHTVDLGGACYMNANTLDGVTCSVSLTHEAEDEQWTSVVGGVAIDNEGTIENCVFDGNISVKSAGAARCGGVAAQTYGSITESMSAGNIFVTSVGDAFCGGIVGQASGPLSLCMSSGIIEVDSGGDAFCGGLAAQTYGSITESMSAGNIFVTSVGDAICGGIVGQASGPLSLCMSSGTIEVDSGGDAFCGGVFGWDSPALNAAATTYLIHFVSKCLSSCTLTVKAGGADSYAGGIGGLQQQGSTRQSVPDADGNETEERMYFADPVTECVFLGTIGGSFDAIGSVLGGLGMQVYDVNSFLLQGELQTIIDGNIYASGGLPAFGTAFDENGNGSVVADKGAQSMPSSDILASALYAEIMSHFAK